jgi:hypothetical protein
LDPVAQRPLCPLRRRRTRLGRPPLSHAPTW